MKQPLAFRLAKRLERQRGDIGHAVLMLNAADELRRLHEANKELLATFKDIVSDYEFSEKVTGYGPRAFAYYETAKRIVAKAKGETE
jgi:hypothetical protein